MNLNFNKLTLRTMITQNRKKYFFLLGEIGKWSYLIYREKK